MLWFGILARWALLSPRIGVFSTLCVTVLKPTEGSSSKYTLAAISGSCSEHPLAEKLGTCPWDVDPRCPSLTNI